MDIQEFVAQSGAVMHSPTPWANSLIMKKIMSYASHDQLTTLRLVNQDFDQNVRRDSRIGLQLDSSRRTPADFFAYVITNGMIPVVKMSIAGLDVQGAEFQDIVRIYNDHVRQLEVATANSRTYNFKTLLQTSLPKVITLICKDLCPTNRYIDEKFYGQLNYSKLKIGDGTFALLAEDANNEGLAVESLLLGSKGLTHLWILGCRSSNRGVKELLNTPRCKQLKSFRFGIPGTLYRSHELSGGFLKTWAESATAKPITSLYTFEICRIADADPETLLHLYTILVRQTGLRNLWVPSIVLHDVMTVDQFYHAENSKVFQSIGSLQYLTKINIPPYFNLKCLNGCRWLNTLVLSKLFEHSTYGCMSENREIFELIFGGSDPQPLKSVERIHLEIFGDTQQQWENIFRWFPNAKELSVDRIHPKCLVSIWKNCLRLQKLKIHLAVREQDFNFDHGFTGHSPIWCDFVREHDADTADWIFDAVPDCSIRDLSDLKSLELEFSAYGVDLPLNDDSRKMTDVSFVHGIFAMPNLKHVQFDNIGSGFFQCVEISNNVRVFLSRERCHNEWKMGYWATSLDGDTSM